MRGIVYKYTNIHNGKVYIGQTINESKRREKWFNLNAPYAGNYINRARIKYGLESFKYEVLFEIETDDEIVLRETLDNIESKYISLYKAKDSRYGYNLSDGGKSGVGQVVTKETRAKISKAHRGLKKPMSDVGKLNISKAHKEPRPYMRKKIVQLTKEGEVLKVWNGIKEAASALNLNHSNISAALTKSGRHRTCGGFKWEYYGITFKKNS